MNKTALYSLHLNLQAKLAPFGDWEMPIYYSSIKEEHLATRNTATLFDISHMGEIFIQGPDAKPFLQYLLTNDLDTLTPYKCFYSTICNEQGGVIDDLFCYMFSKEKYLLVVNAGTTKKDYEHLKTNISDYNVTIENQSKSWAKLDLQGPKAEKILQKITNLNLSDLKRFYFQETQIKNIKVIISRTGYTGEDGFEIYVLPEKASQIWNLLLDIGKEYNLIPAGLGARDILRIEAGYSLYGHELNENITPIEAGIGFVVKAKKSYFLGKKILLHQKQYGTKRKTIYFQMQEKAIPRENCEIYLDDKYIGKVTSGTFSYLLNKGIGIAQINQSIKIGQKIKIKIRNKFYSAITTTKLIK